LRMSSFLLGTMQGLECYPELPSPKSEHETKVSLLSC
jgi:hypothetical protein